MDYERRSSIPETLPSTVRFRSVGGFFAYPSVQVRKCRQLRDFSICDKHRCRSWINRLFTSINLNATDGLFLALRASGPIDRAESSRSAEVRNRDSLPPIGLNSGSESKNGSGSRRYGFHLRCRIILWRGFIVRVINATSLYGSYFVIGTLCNHAPHDDDICIQ
jgi:hypothetical protein